MFQTSTEPDPLKKFIGVDLSDSGNDKTIFSLIEDGILISQKASQVQMNWEKDSKLPMGKLITNELVEFAQRNGIDQRLASHIAVEINGVGASVRDFFFHKIRLLSKGDMPLKELWKKKK